MGKNDLLVAGALFIVAFWLWTLPIQAYPVPFGEGDSVWQFTAGDWMYQNDRADLTIPPYLGNWYYGFNSILGPNIHEYPPPYPLNSALAQLFTNDRFVSAYIMIGLLSMLGCMSTYLLVRKFWGLIPGILAGFSMLFVMRNIMTYLWGQRGSVIAFNFIPVVLYTYYMYLSTDSSKEPAKKSVYLFAFVAVLASEYLFHMQAFGVTGIALFLFTIFYWIKERKFPLPFTKNPISIGLAIVIFLLITMPFILIYLGPDERHEIKLTNHERFLHWFKISDQEGYPVNVGGYPAIYFSYNDVYHKYLIPFIFIGALILLYRRSSKDLVLLGWLAAVYIAVHLDVIGYLNVGRAARMLLAETALFYAIIVVGLFGLLSFIPVKKKMLGYAKIALALVFIAFMLSSNARVAHSTLKDAYPPILRITPYQVEAAEWMKANLPEDAFVVVKGTISYPKIRWMLTYSNRYVGNDVQRFLDANLTTRDKAYYMVDYSDLIITGQQGPAQSLLQWEQEVFANSTLVYDQNNIHIWHNNFEVFRNY